MRIRTETEQDRPQVLKLIEQAFLHAEHSDHTEHLLVERLYQSENFIPQLALVAEIEGNIVGYILFTQLHIGKNIELALAPLAVHPDWQKRGVGRALIERGHDIALELGYHYSVVLGEPAYYGRFGYQPAANWQIQAPFEVPSAYFMMRELMLLAKISGVIRYAKEFGIS